jgi:hypothetical protein
MLQGKEHVSSRLFSFSAGEGHANNSWCVTARFELNALQGGGFNYLGGDRSNPVDQVYTYPRSLAFVL